MPAAIRVFISYSWDSEPHKQRVLGAQRLRDQGIGADVAIIWLNFILTVLCHPRVFSLVRHITI
jgi:hypothetical protein